MSEQRLCKAMRCDRPADRGGQHMGRLYASGRAYSSFARCFDITQHRTVPPYLSAPQTPASQHPATRSMLAPLRICT